MQCAYHNHNRHLSDWKERGRESERKEEGKQKIFPLIYHRMSDLPPRRTTRRRSKGRSAPLVFVGV